MCEFSGVFGVARGKVAKVANFWGYGIGDLGGQIVTTKVAKMAHFDLAGSGRLGLV